MKTETIEERIVTELIDRQLTVTTAESCTGGLLGATLVNVPGVSEVYKEGYITYSDEAKEKLLEEMNTLELDDAWDRDYALSVLQDIIGVKTRIAFFEKD